MKFIDVNKRKEIKKVSKSLLSKYEKCPLWAYKDIRETKPKNFSSKPLEVGILAHEYAAKMLAEKIGVTREVNENKFPLEVVYEVKQMIKKINLDYFYRNLQIIGVEEYLTFESPEVEKDFVFAGRFDALSFTEVEEQKYIVVDDFKTSFVISTEVDSEALIYAYAVNKHFGLPVIFRRISLRNGRYFSHTFESADLEDMKETILFKIKFWKEELEGELIPEYTPGSHCQYCPYLSSCQGRKDISNLNKKYKAAIWAKQFAKKYETEVKAAAAEVLTHTTEIEDGEVLLPFLDNKYGAVAKISKSYSLKTRKFKKEDIIKLLIETGEIDKYINLLDIKLDESLAKELAEDYKIPTKEVVRTTVSLVEKQGEENE